MTTVRPPATVPDRESRRSELAELLELDPALLSDGARLRDDLHVDSLAMMVLLTWLEERGVIIESETDRPSTVDDVLDLVGKASFPGLSITFNDPADGFGGLVTRVLPTISSGDPLAPVMVDHGFRLDPVTPEDVPFLYSLAAQPETSFRWRYRGAPPAIDRFVNDMWQQVLVQYVARRVTDNRQAGHVIAYAAEASMHHCYVAAAFSPPFTNTGAAAQVVALTVRYLFHTFPLQKIYLEVPGFNYQQIASGEGRFFTVEGRLRNHAYYAGRYWDQYLCAVYRPDEFTR